MVNHRIVYILKSFSKADIRRFRDFLNSPFFNRSKIIIKVYEYLISFHPDFKSKLLTKENLCLKAGKDTGYNKSTIDNILADLSYHAENYLMYINFQKKEVKSKDFLLDELFKRNLSKLIEINIKKVKHLLKKTNIDADYYLSTYKILTDELNHTHINKARSGNSIIEYYTGKLTDRGIYLTCLFVTEMLREFDDLSAIGKTFAMKKDSNFIFGIFNEIDFEKILKYLISKSEKEELLIVFNIYLNLYLAFSRFEDQKYYHSYKKLLLENLNIFSSDEKRFHLGKLIRYCKNKSSDVNLSHKYNNELLKLYGYVLSNEYYISSITKYLPVELFRIILHLGLKLKKFNWTMEFIRVFVKKLHPERIDNMLHFSLAEFYFSKRSFSNVLKHINNIELNHFMLKVDLRNLMLMTYYELNEFESALSLVDSYKHFLKYDKTLSKSEKKRTEDFIIILQKMILYKTDPDYRDKVNFEIEISEELHSNNWIEEKILQLKKIG